MRVCRAHNFLLILFQTISILSKNCFIIIKNSINFCDNYHNRFSGGFRHTWTRVGLDSFFLIAILRFFGSSWSLWNGLLHRLNRNSLSGSRKNIAQHYDLGNEMFEKFLDSSFTYSCAIFDGTSFFCLLS